MARLWSSGFELNTIQGSPNFYEFDGTTSTGLSISSTVKRSGTYSLRCAPAGSNGNVSHSEAAGSAGINSARYWRIYFRVDTRPPAENTFMRLMPPTGTAMLVWLTVDSDGILRLYDEDGQIGSASGVLSLATWYRVELLVDRTPAAGSHIVRARLDGVEFAGSSSRNLSTQFNSLRVGCNAKTPSEGHTSGLWYIDDWAVNDETGSEQVGWCGEGSIIAIRPNAIGDSSDWARGGSNSGSNWGQLDEVTPNDITDYVRSNGTLNEKDEHNLQTPSFSNSVVRVVQLGVRYRGEAASAHDSFVLRLKASSVGTVEESSAITPDTTSWHTNTNIAPRPYPLTSYFQPSTSNRWDLTSLTNAQAGYRLSAVSTNRINITALWLNIEYRPIFTATLTDPVVVVPLISRLMTKHALVEIVIVHTYSLTRAITRTYTQTVIVVGSLIKGFYKVYSAVIVIVPTYADLFQAGRLFIERIVVRPTLAKRIWASIWSKIGRTNSSYTGIDKPHC